MRTLLEQAADFKTKTDQTPELRAWLIARAGTQK